MGEEDCKRPLQLLPKSGSTQRLLPHAMANSPKRDPIDHHPPPLNLNLSISIGPIPAASNEEETKGIMRKIQALKWHAAEQIRLASIDKAYAEQVRELARREIEFAEKEFARARLVWERAREDVEKTEKMKEVASRKINSTCMEVTCQACRQRFRQ